MNKNVKETTIIAALAIVLAFIVSLLLIKKIKK